MNARSPILFISTKGELLEQIYTKNMSKNTLVRELQKEVKNLNAVIDMRIIKGLPYKAEARRHKFLVSQLKSLHRQAIPSESWMGKVSQFASMFLF